MPRFYLCAVNTPFNHSLLTYKCSDELEYSRGQLVQVSLGKRKVEACILNELSEAEALKAFELKNIKEIISLNPLLYFEEKDLELLEWCSKYYHYPLGMFIADVLPHMLKRPRPVKFRPPLDISQEIIPNVEQAIFVDKVKKYGMNQFSRWLLHGVTGSGKTIVYVELIKEAFKNKKHVLFLLPEINLTPQFLKTFEASLNCAIYSYNSAITDSDKFGLWRLLAEDQENPILIVGVRSSVFLPIKNLGLIIVDEEHDQSFKQDDRCTYNARDVAIKKASIHKIPVILGSATPSLETYKQTFETEFYFPLKNRALSDRLPVIQFYDQRGQLKIEKERDVWPLSSSTLEKIKHALNKKEQVLVFINRLGYSAFLQCYSCGHTFSCPNCTTHLKFYKKKNVLQCQTCDYEIRKPEMCPECMNLNLLPKGFGTEKVHEVLTQLLPRHRVEKFDRDEIKTMDQLTQTLDQFHRGEIDILVGTQMLSKGHNFKRVNLVVILGIDSELNFPDFRSHERVYQTLNQVSGRAGRFGDNAEVLIHTLSPENQIFSYIKNHSFDDFYRDEISIRKKCFSPPHVKMIAVYFSGKNQHEVIEFSESACEQLKDMAQKHFKSVYLLGPRPAMIEKKVNQFTWLCLLKGQNINDLHNLLLTFQKNQEFNRHITIKLDVDPYFVG